MNKTDCTKNDPNAPTEKGPNETETRSVNDDIKYEKIYLPKYTTSRNDLIVAHSSLTGYYELINSATNKTIYKGYMNNSYFQNYGIWYYENGCVRYDGKWDKGKRYGYGKCYNQNGCLLYKGLWRDGMRHGPGVSFFSGQVEFTGIWKENLIHNGLLIGYAETNQGRLVIVGYTTNTKFNDPNDSLQTGFWYYDQDNAIEEHTYKDGKIVGIRVVEDYFTREELRKKYNELFLRN